MITYMNFLTNSTIKMKKIQRIRVDEVFYQIGKVFWLPFGIAGFWFAWMGYDKYGEMTACAIRRMCGLPCPGCGGTRAFYYLFQGDFIKSFCLNPTVIYGILAYLHFMLLFFCRKHITRTIVEKEIHIQYYMYIAIGVILLQWSIKLIIILFFL